MWRPVIGAVVRDAALLRTALEEHPPLHVSDRRVHARRPAAFLAWAIAGGVATHVDKIHEAVGVVAYPDPEWIGEVLPVSPAYVFGSIVFFIAYTVIVGHRGRSQGVFGGRPITLLEFGLAVASWIVAYTISGVLGASASVRPELPWVGALILLLWALPDLWAARRTRLPLYAAFVAVLGVGFEAAATTTGGFVYPVCPGPECLGTTVPAAWLGLLYVHAALFVHRMMGGRHYLVRWLSAR